MSKGVLLLTVWVMCLSSCTRVSPTDSFDQKHAAEMRVSLGLSYLKAGNFSQAKFNLDKAFEYAPKSADVNFGLAYYYQQVEEFELAEQTYLQALAYAPDNADIVNSYGAFLCERGRYEQAEQYFLQAINTRDYVSSAATYQNLALCSQQAGQRSQALEYLRSAVNHQPNNPSSLLMLTRALIQQQQWQEARDTLRHYERTSQVNPQSLISAVQIETGAGNSELAAEYQAMLRKVYPEHPDTIAWLSAQAPRDITADSAIRTNGSNLPAPQVRKVLKGSSGPSAGELGTGELNNQHDNLQNVGYHIVMPGENLYRISLLYNIKLQRLLEWNQLSEGATIHSGMKLKITDKTSDE